MDHSLVPPLYSAIVLSGKKVSIFISGLTVFLLLLLCILGVFHDKFTAIFLSCSLMIIDVLLLLPGLMYSRICESRVDFSVDSIKILRKDHCWREVFYDQITGIQIQEIPGFFYGKDKYTAKNTYIFFLNERLEIPNTSFFKLFTSKDCLIVNYQEKTYDDFRKNYSLFLSNTVYFDG